MTAICQPRRSDKIGKGWPLASALATSVMFVCGAENARESINVSGEMRGMATSLFGLARFSQKSMMQSAGTFEGETRSGTRRCASRVTAAVTCEVHHLVVRSMSVNGKHGKHCTAESHTSTTTTSLDREVRSNGSSGDTGSEKTSAFSRRLPP